MKTEEDLRQLGEISLYDAKLFQKEHTTHVSEALKSVFFLTSGSFALSITFISYLSRCEIVGPNLLIFAWALLLLSTVLYTILQWISSRIADKKHKHTNASRREGHEPEWGQRIDSDPEINTLSKYANLSFYLTVSCAFFGLALLITFASVNLLSRTCEQSRSDSDNQTLKLPDTGYPPHTSL